MSRRNIAALSLFMIGSVVMLACSEDDDADPKAAASGTGATSTGATGPGGGGAGATGGGGSGATGGGGAGAAGCSAVPLSDALAESGTWDDSFTIAGFGGPDGFGPTVHDLALDSDGSLLAVGFFSYIGKDKVRPFARLENGVWAADPRLDMDLPQPEISAIAVADDGRVAISSHTLFPSPLEQREGGIYVSNDTGGFTLVGEFHGAVRTMTWFEDKLWVGGYFMLDGDPAPPNLALWDGETWQGPPGGPAQEPSIVMEIAHDDGGLMIGGFFENIGGIAAQSAARFGGGGWEAYDLPDSTVMAFARDGNDTLYAGGLMSVEGSQVNGGVARWSGTSWQSMDGGLANLTFRGVVADLAVLDGELVVAGCFKWAGGAAEAPGTIEVSGMARWTGSAWEAFDDGSGSSVVSAWISSLKCGDEGPPAAWESERQRMLVDGNRLYLAGSFAGEGGVPSQSIIAYENGQWLAQGESGRGWSGTARALAVGGPECSVYALGATHAGDLDIGLGVVKDDNDAWVQVAGPVPAGRSCYSITADAAGTAYIGCEYLKSEADPYYTGVVYKSVGDAWEQVGGDYEGGIAALGIDPAGHLWIVGGGEKGFVAREEGGSFTTTEFDARVSVLSFAPTAEGEPVRAAVAGFFTKVEDTQAVGVAQFDGTQWNALGEGVLAYITSVAYGPDDVVYVGTGDGTPGVPVVSRWDGTAWEDVAQPEPGPVESGYQIYSMLARGKYLVAAGFGYPESGERNVFLWNDETKVWSSLAGGVPAISVDTVALAANGLWFGGFIAEAGAPGARIPSVGVAHLK